MRISEYTVRFSIYSRAKIVRDRKERERERVQLLLVVAILLYTRETRVFDSAECLFARLYNSLKLSTAFEQRPLHIVELRTHISLLFARRDIRGGRSVTRRANVHATLSGLAHLPPCSSSSS